MKRTLWFVIVGLWLLAAFTMANAGETISFLEEHTVQPGVFVKFGARYTVPPGKKATVTSFSCWVGVWANQAEQNNVQVAIVIDTARTVRGPATPWQGFNPISCFNGPNAPTAMTQSGPVVLYPGDTMSAFYTNNSPNLVFVNAGAAIHEEDL